MTDRPRAMDDVSIRDRADRAHKEIAKLCKGAKRWSMSIPVDFDYDSDQIFAICLDDIEYLLAQNAARLAEIARLEIGLVGKDVAS